MKFRCIGLFVFFVIFSSIYGFSIERIIYPGNGIFLLSNNHFLTYSSIYQFSDSAYLNFDLKKNVKLAFKNESLFVISDYKNLVNIYSYNSLGINIIDSFIINENIERIFIDDSIIWANLSDKSSRIFIYNVGGIREIALRHNLKIRDMKIMNNKCIVLPENNTFMYLIENINDTFNLIDSIVNDNIQLIFKNTDNYLITYNNNFLRFYSITDSFDKYYLPQYIGGNYKKVFANFDTLLIFYKNSILYSYNKQNPTYYTFKDSIIINFPVFDIDIEGDTLLILSNDYILKYNFSTKLLYDTLRFNYSVNDIINYNNNFFLWIDDNIYELNLEDSTIEKLSYINNVISVRDSCIIQNDSIMYVLRDSIIERYNFNDIIQNAQINDSILYYSNLNNQLHKFNLNSEEDIFLFESNYSIYDFIFTDSLLKVSSGYYGVKDFDLLGIVLNEYYFPDLISTLSSNNISYFLKSENRGFYVINESDYVFYPYIVNSFYKDSKRFYILTDDSIMSYNNTLLLYTIYNGDYKNVLDIGLNTNDKGVMFVKGNILLEIGENITRKFENSQVIDTISTNIYNTIYDINGRIVKSSQNMINTTNLKPGIYFVKTSNRNIKKILILK